MKLQNMQFHVASLMVSVEDFQMLIAAKDGLKYMYSGTPHRALRSHVFFLQGNAIGKINHPIITILNMSTINRPTLHPVKHLLATVVHLKKYKCIILIGFQGILFTWPSLIHVDSYTFRFIIMSVYKNIKMFSTSS